MKQDIGIFDVFDIPNAWIVWPAILITLWIFVAVVHVVIGRSAQRRPPIVGSPTHTKRTSTRTRGFAAALRMCRTTRVLTSAVCA